MAVSFGEKDVSNLTLKNIFTFYREYNTTLFRASLKLCSDSHGHRVQMMLIITTFIKGRDLNASIHCHNTVSLAAFSSLSAPECLLNCS